MPQHKADPEKAGLVGAVETLPLETEITPRSMRDIQSDPSELRIGPYSVVRTLGQGGMGSVFLAVRADMQYEQYVAIKVIKRGMDTDEIIRRFRRERQILANLEHPNIAKLMDGGSTDDGLPYFVMEYIRGTPLQEYCSSKRLRIRERLEIFRTICSAVQYAHQNLIVHRDLKPGNILVTVDGAPKLLDFGLAKLLTVRSEPDFEPLTVAEDRLMTPEYASPEQARGEPITTATDVYSLGIILYELLTQRRPYRFTSREPDAVARVISQSQPEKPSSVITRKLKDTSADVAISRSWLSQRKLRKALEGDLDNIVMMALRKEPQYRYPSVEALSEDIRCYLGGLPVQARKPTLPYRAGKFISRNKAALAGTAALLIVLIGFAITMAVQSVRLARERDAAARERDRAEQVTAFLTGVFSISDPSEARGNTITAREVLDKGAAQIETSLKDQPDVRATMLDTMGRVYENLGLYDRASELFVEALAIRRSIYGENEPLVADSIHALATLRYEMGNYDSSEQLHRQALNIRRGRYGSEHESVAESLNGLALLCHSKGEYDEAEKLYREVLSIERKLPEKEHADVATAINNLGLVLHDKGDYVAAEPLYRESLEMDRRAHGDVHPHVSRDLNNLASLLQDKGDYKAAEPLFRRAVDLNRVLFGQEHPEVATSLNNLGRILQDMGNDEAAEPLFREAVAMNRKILGEGHPSLMRMQHNLAVLLMETGRAEEAEPLLREVLERDREILGNEHPFVLSHLHNMGLLLCDLGEFAEAEGFLREELAIARQVYSGSHKTTARALVCLAEILMDRGKWKEAEPLLQEGIVMTGATREKKDPFLFDAHSVLGKYQCRTGEKQAALQLLRQSYNSLLSSPAASTRIKSNARKRMQDCS